MKSVKILVGVEIFIAKIRKNINISVVILTMRSKMLDIHINMKEK